MRSVWIVLVIVLATGHLGDKLLVSSLTLDEPSGLDDMYLEGQASGGLPSDDEDGQDNFSGSGSDELRHTDILEEANTTKWLGMSPVTQENIPTFTLESTSSPTTMQEESTTTYVLQDKTEVTGLEPSDDTSLGESLQPGSTDDLRTTTDPADASLEDRVLLGTGGGVQLEASPGDRALDSTEQVTSEDMMQRMDVLAAVIACGVVGFLCAVFLVLLLAYRMKKKDEGSYALGVAKLPPNTDQKQPAQEFYA